MQKILVATDFSFSADCASRVAATQALLWGAEVVLVHVDPSPIWGTIAIEPIFIPPNWVERMRDKQSHALHSELALRKERLERSFAGLKVSTEIIRGDVATTLCDAAKAHRADLLVMATRGAGASRFLLGSVTAKVSSHAPCPVLVVCDDNPSAVFSKACIAVDFSDFSKPLTLLADRFVAADGELELVHVWHAPHGAFWLTDEEKAKLGSDSAAHVREALATFTAGLQVKHRMSSWVGEGSPAQTLLDHARDRNADLIVIGAHGRGGTARMIGTVCDRVLRHSQVNVLVLPADAR